MQPGANGHFGVGRFQDLWNSAHAPATAQALSNHPLSSHTPEPLPSHAQATGQARTSQAIVNWIIICKSIKHSLTYSPCVIDFCKHSIIYLYKDKNENTWKVRPRPHVHLGSVALVRSNIYINWTISQISACRLLALVECLGCSKKKLGASRAKNNLSKHTGCF